jgi:hypothetical protein
MVDDDESCLVEIEGDAVDFSGGYGGPDRSRVQQIRERQVIDVLRGSCDLLETVLAKYAAPDRPGHAGL